MQKKSVEYRHKYKLLFFYALIVLGISYCTYFQNYWNPPNLFWDENYHIASAYKYLDQVMFMEAHPPLGKLFIALGEYIFRPNTTMNTRDFLTTDYINDVPQGFSFIGVRFFPTFFATCSALLFFLICYLLLKRSFLAFLFTSFYLFENALIVQSRGAMLEGTQVFFILLSLFYFLLLLDREKLSFVNYFFLGICVGLSVAIKINALILIYFLPALLFYETTYMTKGFSLRDISLKTVVFPLGFLLTFCGSYYIHGMLGQHVLQGKYYQASGQYKQLLAGKKTGSITSLPVILQDNLSYMRSYEANVPFYDACKVGENGSLPYMWPFGDKSIDYRWDSNNGKTSYLYLQGNPLIWLTGLIGVLFGCVLFISRLVFQLTVTKKRFFFLLTLFLFLYVSYMAASLMMQRVLYLYHYFIPLLLSLFIFILLFDYRFEKLLNRRDKRLYVGICVFVIAIIAVYYFFSPLTYHEPLTKSEFLLRSWFPFWHLTPDS